jgi:hypothetical protein
LEAASIGVFSPLTLFVPHVLADHANGTVATDDLAVTADLLD